MSEGIDSAEAPHSQQELIVGCILLLVAEERSHGYGLSERIKQLMPLWDMSPGHIYRDLRKLADEGLLVSVWEASQTRGPARRVYEITPAGRLALDEWASGTAALIKMLERCISAHGSLPAGERPGQGHEPTV